LDLVGHAQLFAYISYDPGNTGKCPAGKLAVENGEKKGQNSGVSPTEYKLPLVWIDLEMTGKLA